MTIQIEQNVPVPMGGRKYPFGALEIGESFFIPGKTASELGGSISHANRVCYGRKFTSRTRIENGVRGVRVWRYA